MVIGTFNAAGNFLHPSLDCRSKDNSLDYMAWFVLWLALSTMGSYIERFVPFQIMCNQLYLPQVDYNQVVAKSERSSAETGCAWANFKCHGKGCEYVQYVRTCFVFVFNF